MDGSHNPAVQPFAYLTVHTLCTSTSTPSLLSLPSLHLSSRCQFVSFLSPYLVSTLCFFFYTFHCFLCLLLTHPPLQLTPPFPSFLSVSTGLLADVVVRVTPNGLTLSLLPTPLILHPLLSLIITGYMEQTYRLNTKVIKVKGVAACPRL